MKWIVWRTALGRALCHGTTTLKSKCAYTQLLQFICWHCSTNFIQLVVKGSWHKTQRCSFTLHMASLTEAVELCFSLESSKSWLQSPRYTRNNLTWMQFSHETLGKSLNWGFLAQEGLWTKLAPMSGWRKCWSWGNRAPHKCVLGSRIWTADLWLCHTFSSNPAAEVALMLWKPTKAPQTVLNVSILNVRCWHKYGIACNQQFSGILLKLEEAEPSVSWRSILLGRQLLLC